MRKKKEPSPLGDFVGDSFVDSRYDISPISATELYEIRHNLKHSPIRHSRPFRYLRYLINLVYYSPLFNRNSKFKELESIRDRNIDNREQFLNESMKWAFWDTHLGLPAAASIIDLRTAYPKDDTKKLYTRVRYLILRKI